MNTLAYQEVGDPSKPTIVFLHGGGLAGWMWDQQIAILSESYHCLVPDLPEHGASMAMKPFTMRYAAELVSTHIKEKALNGRAHIVGLSLGGQVALDMLSYCPEVIDHMIISGTLVRPMKGYGKWLSPMVKVSAPLVSKRWFARLQAKQLAVPETYFERYFSTTKDFDAQSLEHVLRANNTFELPLSFRSSGESLLVLAGEKELKPILQSQLDIMDALPASRGFIIIGAGHAVNFTAPELFAEIISAWLSDRALPAGMIEIKK